MGKNFGSNSKAEEGRARKAAAKEAEKEKQRAEKQKAEDKKWEEGARDDSRKRAEEAKRLEKLIKKQELRSLEQQEEKELAKIKTVKNNSGKSLQVPTTSHTSTTLKSMSLNWSLSTSDDGSSVTTEAYSASNIDDALLLLESANTSASSMTIEKHPERRVKAAFAVFEAREMPKLKAENPTLRHTQLMERLHKMWQKSPENPFNQLHIAHNASRDEQTRVLQEDVDRNLDRLRIN